MLNRPLRRTRPDLPEPKNRRRQATQKRGAQGRRIRGGELPGRENGVSFFYFYDATDELAVKSPTNVRTDPGATSFTYDNLGNLLTSAPSRPDAGVVVPTTYTYDPVGHTKTITASGVTTTFTFDALGRHATQKIRELSLGPPAGIGCQGEIAG